MSSESFDISNIDLSAGADIELASEPLLARKYGSRKSPLQQTRKRKNEITGIHLFSSLDCALGGNITPATSIVSLQLGASHANSIPLGIEPISALNDGSAGTSKAPALALAVLLISSVSLSVVLGFDLLSPSQTNPIQAAEERLSELTIVVRPDSGLMLTDKGVGRKRDVALVGKGSDEDRVGSSPVTLPKSTPEASTESDKFAASVQTIAQSDILTVDEIQTLFGDEPTEPELDIFEEQGFSSGKEGLVLNAWAMKAQASNTSDISSTPVITASVEIPDLVSTVIKGSEISELVDQSSTNGEAFTTANEQSLQDTVTNDNLEASPEIDIEFVDALFAADEAAFDANYAASQIPSPNTAVATSPQQAATVDSQSSAPILIVGSSTSLNSLESVGSNASISDLGNESETSSTTSTNPQNIDLESDVVTSDSLVNGATSDLEFSWFENFDGPGLDLRRFLTPGSKLSVDNDALQLSLAATHTDISQDEVQLIQTIALKDGMKKFEARLSVVDLSKAVTGIKPSASTFMLEVPLVRTDQTGKKMGLIARVTLHTDVDNRSHSITSGIYERVNGSTLSGSPLGETAFMIGREDLTELRETPTTFDFLLDTSFSERIDLVVNDNRLSIPVTGAFPETQPTVSIDLSAQGAGGEYSRIDASISNLMTDSELILNIGGHVLENNSAPTLGHSLSVQNSAVRLSASGESLDTARVLLATRTDQGDFDWVREIESTSFVASVTLENLTLNRQHVSNEGELGLRTAVIVSHTLFEMQEQGRSNYMVAVLHIRPREETNNNGFQLADVTAQLVMIEPPVGDVADWHTVIATSQVVEEIGFQSSVAIAQETPVQIVYADNIVTFTLGNAAVELSHDFDTRWFPTSNSTSAMAIETGSGETMVVDIDNVGVTRR